MGLFGWLRSLGDAPENRPNIWVEGSYWRRGGRWTNANRPPRSGERGFFRAFTWERGHRHHSPVFETWEDGAGRHVRQTDLTGDDLRSWRTSVNNRLQRGMPNYDDPDHWMHQVTREDVQRDFRQRPEPRGWRGVDDTYWGLGWRSDRPGREPDEPISLISKGGSLLSRWLGAGNDLDRGGGVMPAPTHERPRDYECGCGDWRCPYN